MKYTIPLALALTAFIFSACQNNNSAEKISGEEPSNSTITTVDKNKKTETDSILALTPDGRKGAFIRSQKRSGPDTEGSSPTIDQIWLYDKASATSKLIVQGTENNPEPENMLESLGSLVFSPDGLYLYFSSAAWVTSGAIHRYDLSSGKEKFISAGNGLQVIPSGKYKGFLVTSLHKYFNGGGSYDYFYLLTPDGKEVMQAGKDENETNDFISRNK